MLKEGKNMIIGNKDQFAIEIYDLDSIRAHVNLWLGNEIIGSGQDLEYLKQVHYQLSRIIELDKAISFEGINEHFDINYLIENEENLKEQLLLNIGESFDDFLIRVVVVNDYINFYWKLVDSPYYRYDNIIKGKSYSNKVSKELYKEVLKQFELVLNQENKGIWQTDDE